MSEIDMLLRDFSCPLTRENRLIPRYLQKTKVVGEGTFELFAIDRTTMTCRITKESLRGTARASVFCRDLYTAPNLTFYQRRRYAMNHVFAACLFNYGIKDND